jgi:hypothetical protein
MSKRCNLGPLPRAAVTIRRVRQHHWLGRHPSSSAIRQSTAAGIVKVTIITGANRPGLISRTG